jgi:hypothetical protein
MLKLLLSACSILAFCSVSWAQTATPRWELMGGYTYYLAGGEFGSVSPGGGFVNPGQIPTYGFQVGLSRSLRSYFRVTSELNEVFGKEALAVEHLPAGGEYKTGNEFMALFGPEATLRKMKRFDFALHYWIGVAHAVDNQVPAVPNNSFTCWVQGVGMGMDWKIKPRIAVRVIEWDWITSHFPKQNFDAEDNWRFTTGIVYRFGQ